MVAKTNAFGGKYSKGNGLNKRQAAPLRELKQYHKNKFGQINTED